MSKIPAETLDAISARIDATDVIGRYVQLKRRGRKATGLCPFHGERTPSFTVDQEKGLWYCFGCGEGGSVFSFLMKIEGLNFPQAVQRLGEEVGIEVVADDADDPEKLRRDKLRELLERSTQYYAELLHRSPLAESARTYLKARGIASATAQKFRLGWAPESGDALARKLKEAGYQAEDGMDAGVLRERYGKTTDLLRGRLVFPITNGQGKVVAFGGRLIEVVDGSKAPKYLNSPETELYQKREHLYGLSFHRPEISRANEAMVMEGYLDVIAVSQAGFPTAVASLGTALTEEQCRLLSRYARKVHLFYDADRAGISATEKAIELFENAGLLVHIGVMEPGQDPDSVIQEEGPEAFGRIKDSTVGVVEYLIDRKSQEFDMTSRIGKADFAAAVLPAVAKVKDGASRSHYIRSLATRLGVGENSLQAQMQSGGRARVTSGQNSSRARLSSDAGPNRSIQSISRVSSARSSVYAEERLLILLLRRPEWVEFVAERLDPTELSRAELRPLLEVLLRFRSNEKPLTWTDLRDLDPGQEVVWARLSATEAPESTNEDMETLIRDIKRNGLEPRYEEIRRQVLEGFETGEVGPESSLYKEYLDLQQRLKGTKNE